MPFVASWSFAFVEFAVVLYIVLLTGFCIAVIISALLSKTTWLRPPEETPKQKARREALQARADLCWVLFFGFPAGRDDRCTYEATHGHWLLIEGRETERVTQCMICGTRYDQSD
jgi:hypothetical protein